MANWAETSYFIEGDKNDLKRLYDTIDRCFKSIDESDPTTPDGDWEEVIALALGATEEKVENSRLRGFIKMYEWSGDVIRLEAEEAWYTSDFRFILQELLPSLKVYFMTEEPGCEVYVTNDADWKYFPDKFYMEYCINGNIESEYFSNKTDALNCAAKLIGRESIDKEELEKWNKENKDEGSYIYLHEFEIID